MTPTHAMTAEQRIAFETRGFLVIENTLAGDELSDVRAAADRGERLWRSESHRPGIRSDTLDQVQSPIEYDEILLNLLWHPRVFPLVREAIGDDIMMIDNDYYITPPHTAGTHAGWHHDVGMRGVYHPQSVMMVKVFYLLSDVGPNSGGTAMIPGSHRLPMDFSYPRVDDPKQMPGHVQMTGRAGTAYMFNGRVYHAAVTNESDAARRVLIYNYGHLWMKQWPGYEPSQRLLDAAVQTNDPIHMQVLGLGHAYSSYLKGNSP